MTLDPIPPGAVALLALVALAIGALAGAFASTARLRVQPVRAELPPVSPEALASAAAILRDAERVERVALRLDEVDARLHDVERHVARVKGEAMPAIGAPVSRKLRERGGWEDSTDPALVTGPRKKIDP